MIEDEFENFVSQLHSEAKWKEIISLYANKETNETCRRLLWVWPTMADLNWIKFIISDCGLDGIVSIGCGTGLLEWIIQQHSQFPVIGVEVDQLWWESPYSPAFYLDNIIFTSKTNSLINIPHNYGILFCYFNNGPAFEDYINNYHGKIVLIIGPIEGQNRSTNPLPSDVIKLKSFGWKLNNIRKLDNNKDCIAVYIRE
ncbi:hypothetical protein PV327_003000 [Microctonus hyperodae]|uniref:Uncharacterized protein n=1 Tax=Microctonus hyperodae TaxID=165561 RepID=A0AA39G350_MICHY|nr:hypothetical protein PV327_003000 [Microctonus hyperodae]